MNETVWLETSTGELVNLSKVAFIKSITRMASIEIMACFDSEAMPIVIAKVTTQRAATRFLDKLSMAIRLEKKYINASMFATQAENEKDME